MLLKGNRPVYYEKATCSNVLVFLNNFLHTANLTIF